MRPVLLVAMVLASCTQPPRDAEWFEANPEAAAKVVESCAKGARTNECENARAGLGKAKAKARMERYRRGFE